MKNFKDVWKQLASDKNVTNSETFQYCILRAMAAVHPDKEMIASYFVLRAYTVIKNNNKLDNGMYPYFGLFMARAGTTKRSESPLISCLETPEEEALFWKLADYNYVEAANIKLSKKFYSFVFVRPDISPEQQLVQVGHVNAALGWKMAGMNGSNFIQFTEDLFQSLHMVVCYPTPYSLEEIKKDINNHGYDVIEFREPDIGNEVTAIASFPIKGNNKGFLRHHKALKFPKPVISARERVQMLEVSLRQ